ncbi:MULTISPECIES: toprim domain-containing protein [Weeksellaceae]|uniref:DNA primase n=6 Tax=Weeksellaceae TaxID=2762318 RepID=A0A085BHP4_9FLAO|nr:MULTISPECIES: toprim domain-containing protein [Weeksellaceae]OPC59463.1 DNA primase [Elizabethkingia bruuniana]QIY82491.1 DNA primase [Chryseobacterium sp. NEB161]KFC21989.1 DNA primase [Epilithonimonas lactis]KUY19671.1 DNA primase [Elizabethkingia miricola]MCL1651301.1 toprim domain-containing protein [Elizabethkingia miricola]
MNCKTANENINIREILDSFSLFPSKENLKSAFYFAFDRKERTPSVIVNFGKNTAFDFGTGKQYDNVSLVQAIKKCSVSEALEYLRQFEFSSFDRNDNSKNKQNSDKKSKTNYEILEIKNVERSSLLSYLKSRNLESQKSDLKEIYYLLHDKNYFGLGFKNNSSGYEIRNKYSKICLGKKDISTIKNGSETLRIFEGFTDYLSFKILEKSLEKEPSDYLILNSVSILFKAKTELENHQKVELYFDNDEAGNLATEQLINLHKNITDERLLYKNHKDLNAFLMNNEIKEERRPKYGR